MFLWPDQHTQCSRSFIFCSIYITVLFVTSFDSKVANQNINISIKVLFIAEKYKLTSFIYITKNYKITKSLLLCITLSNYLGFKERVSFKPRVH